MERLHCVVDGQKRVKKHTEMFETINQQNEQFVSNVWNNNLQQNIVSKVIAIPANEEKKNFGHSRKVHACSVPLRSNQNWGFNGFVCAHEFVSGACLRACVFSVFAFVC